MSENPSTVARVENKAVYTREIHAAGAYRCLGKPRSSRQREGAV